MTLCPRPHCGGTLVTDPNEANTLKCLLCERRFMRMLGKLIELSARPPSPEERPRGGKRRRGKNDD